MSAKLKSLVKLRKTLQGFPDSTYGGADTIKAIRTESMKIVDNAINRRGEIVRFIKVRGRIIPIRKKV